MEDPEAPSDEQREWLHKLRREGSRPMPMPFLGQQDENPQVGSGGGLGVPVNQYRPNVRHLIDERIDYHNRMSTNLHALLRALPQEMSRDAENALSTLVVESRQRPTY